MVLIFFISVYFYLFIFYHSGAIILRDVLGRLRVNATEDSSLVLKVVLIIIFVFISLLALGVSECQANAWCPMRVHIDAYLAAPLNVVQSPK